MPVSENLTKALRLAAVAATVMTILLLPSLSSAADLFYNATIGLPLGDDARFFLNLTNEHYAVPEPTAVAVVQRCPQPQDDYPVVMLLARATGRDPGAILSLRLRGTPWIDVFARFQVSPDILFVGMDHDPGPPYGNAWGYWKNHRHDHHERMVLADTQIVDLAKLQIVSGYYHVSPYTVVAERQRGATVERYAVAHGRHSGGMHGGQGGPGNGQRPAHGHDGHDHQGHDQGHDHDKGQGHSHHEGHGPDHD